MPRADRLSSRPVLRSVVVVAAAAALAAVLLLARGPRVPTDGAPGGVSPDAAVAALVSAERAGDVEAYREGLTGEALEAFESRLRGVGAGQVAAGLRGGLAGLKGHATSEVRQEGSDAATLVLELIFADRHERQRVELRRTGGVWKISGRTPMERITPEVPYGTPVFTPPAEEGPAPKSHQ